MYFLRTHARVTSALLIREMSARFGDKPGGYAWALLEPISHIALLTFLFGVIARVPAIGSSFALFFATGFMGFQFYQGTAQYVSGALKANSSLLSYPIVAPIDTIVARFILQICTTLTISLMVFVGIAFSLHTPMEIRWPYIGEAIFLAIFLGLGISMINSILFVRYALYEQIYSIVTRPMFMLSGVFYLPDSMPRPYQDILLMNPLAHITMLFREGFYPEYRADGLDLAYLCDVAFVVFLLGLFIFTMGRDISRAQ